MNILHVYAFFLAFLFSIVYSLPQKRATASEIEDIIANLTSLATMASTALENWDPSNPTLAQALAIHSALGDLNQAFSDGTTTLESSLAVSEADGEVIVREANNGLTPAVNTIFAQIGDFRGGESLPIGGIDALIKQDGETLESESTAFYGALFVLLPADLRQDLEFPEPPIVIIIPPEN